jgi:hypothetical protein
LELAQLGTLESKNIHITINHGRMETNDNSAASATIASFSDVLPPKGVQVLGLKRLQIVLDFQLSNIQNSNLGKRRKISEQSEQSKQNEESVSLFLPYRDLDLPFRPRITPRELINLTDSAVPSEQYDSLDLTSHRTTDVPEYHSIPTAGHISIYRLSAAGHGGDDEEMLFDSMDNTFHKTHLSGESSPVLSQQSIEFTRKRSLSSRIQGTDFGDSLLSLNIESAARLTEVAIRTLVGGKQKKATENTSLVKPVPRRSLSDIAPAFFSPGFLKVSKSCYKLACPKCNGAYRKSSGDQNLYL